MLFLSFCGMSECMLGSGRVGWIAGRPGDVATAGCDVDGMEAAVVPTVVVRVGPGELKVGMPARLMGAGIRPNVSAGMWKDAMRICACRWGLFISVNAELAPAGSCPD